MFAQRGRCPDPTGSLQGKRPECDPLFQETRIGDAKKICSEIPLASKSRRPQAPRSRRAPGEIIGTARSIVLRVRPDFSSTFEEVRSDAEAEVVESNSRRCRRPGPLRRKSSVGAGARSNRTEGGSGMEG